MNTRLDRQARTPGPDSLITTEPLPASTKVYVEGSAGIRVPFREIQLTETSAGKAGGHSLPEPNPPLRVYDTSGPYSDPAVAIDPRAGLASVRDAWIVGRGDTEVVEGARRGPRTTGIGERRRLTGLSVSCERGLCDGRWRDIMCRSFTTRGRGLSRPRWSM